MRACIVNELQIKATLLYNQKRLRRLFSLQTKNFAGIVFDFYFVSQRNEGEKRENLGNDLRYWNNRNIFDVTQQQPINIELIILLILRVDRRYLQIVSWRIFRSKNNFPACLVSLSTVGIKICCQKWRSCQIRDTLNVIHTCWGNVCVGMSYVCVWVFNFIAIFCYNLLEILINDYCIAIIYLPSDKKYTNGLILCDLIEHERVNNVCNDMHVNFQVIEGDFEENW